MDGIGMLFDDIAEQYDRVRPTYPAQMYDDLARRVPAAPSVLEVGCGTGQATRDLLARGWRVHAVEPGHAMAERASANLAGQDFTVDVATFDDWVPSRTYDLLFAATSYHWVAPDIRWQRAADVLTPNGTCALVTNRTVAGGTFHELYAESADLHRKHAPEVAFGMSPAADDLIAEIDANGHDLGAAWRAVVPDSGDSLAGDLFDPPELTYYQWETAYDAADAAALLSTFSPYLQVPLDRRTRLLDGMADIVTTRFGGRVTRHYLAVLAVTRKREQDRDS